MKRFWKYIFPSIYGLLIYFTIRLLMDSVTGTRFWKRPWQLNTIEISTSLVVSYIFIWSFGRLLAWFDRKWPIEFSSRRVIRELGYVALMTTIISNVFLTTMCATTDDGLQWADLVDVNVVPLLFAFIYYSLVRSYTFLKAYVNSKVQLEKITNDQLDTELKFLRAQYHPHFLFNALNTIYFQMDENVAEAKKSVEKFSELLRYQLYDQQQTVPISQEIHYLRNYIQLQEIRSSEKLRLSTHFDEKLTGQKVYPLLLLPLVENAFKYVGGAWWIRIEARLQGADLHFTVSNAIPAEIIHYSKSSGIGLDNLQRRLQLLYPGKHTFEIEKLPDQFIARLTLIGINEPVNINTFQTENR